MRDLEMPIQKIEPYDRSPPLPNPLPRSGGEGTGSKEILRTPCSLTSQGQPLFAWWHAAKEHNADHAVVIAAPIGYEQIHAHRSLRHLAEALARQGIPALRFDWHGTGDSAGVDEEADRWPVWQQNLRDAVAFVRQEFGARRVSVIGLRLGATMAATGLVDAELANLVLWAPVISGRTFVRELTAIDRTSEIPRKQVPSEPYDLEPSGCVLTEETAAVLSRVDLLPSPPPTCATLLVSRDDSMSDAKLVNAYREAGVDVEQVSFAGYAEMMTSPHRSEVPHEAIRSIVAWLANRIEPDETTIPETSKSELILRYQHESRSPAHPERTLRERPLCISSRPDVFGILTEPTPPVDESRPTIVLLNAGAVYRIGPGRLNVHLARRLAAEGFRCVRIDANNLGDSVTPAGSEENNTYATTILRDVDTTLDFLPRERLGEKFVVVGLCSGAYFAFQSAVTLENAALVESVLINPLTYYWRDGMRIEDSLDRQVVVQEYFREAACDPQKWWKFLSGQSKTGLRGAVRVLRDRGRLHAQRWLSRQPSEMREPRPAYSHPLRDDLPFDLAEVRRRERKLSFFFADTDPGLAILTHKAGRAVQRMRRAGQAHIEFIADADHNFSRRAARSELLAKIARHLTARYAGW